MKEMFNKEALRYISSLEMREQKMRNRIELLECYAKWTTGGLMFYALLSGFCLSYIVLCTDVLK